MPAWLQLKYAHANGLLNDDIFAVANILKVMSLHRVSDIYGPLPVLHFGETENPYNSQEECYMHFFETLDSAIAVLKDVVENNPDARNRSKRSTPSTKAIIRNGSSSPTR